MSVADSNSFELLIELLADLLIQDLMAEARMKDEMSPEVCCASINQLEETARIKFAPDTGASWFPGWRSEEANEI